jgi:hypothetical protein
MPINKVKTCAHIPCTCVVPAGQKYCSQSGEEAGSDEVAAIHVILPPAPSVFQESSDADVYTRGSVRRASGFVVCWACSTAWRWKSSPNLMEVKGSKTQWLSLQRGHSSANEV